MSQDVVQLVEQLLAKAPQWIRQDLSSGGHSTRRRAEETLAAMIAAALRHPPERSDDLDKHGSPPSAHA